MSVPVLTEAGALLARYDVLISDVWGVVHDGVWALQPACDALIRFREAGGAVVLLSNAPGPSQHVAGVLDKKRVPRQAWDRLVTSGDVTKALIAGSHHHKVFHIGWHDDRSIFEGADILLVGEDEADLVVATELNDYRTETPEQYRPQLARFAARVCPSSAAIPISSSMSARISCPAPARWLRSMRSSAARSPGPASRTGRPMTSRWRPPVQRAAVMRSTPPRCWSLAMRFALTLPARE